MSRLPAVPEKGCPGPSELDSRRAGFVLGLDVGSSVIRCHVYDHAALVRGSSAQKVTGKQASGRGSGSRRAPGVG